jgi:hypothetical protein
LFDPEVEPDGEHKSALDLKKVMGGHTRIQEGQTTAQGDETWMPKTPNHGAAAAVDRNNLDLEEKAPNCKIVADFFDVGTTTVELHDGRALDPGDVSCLWCNGTSRLS